MKDFQTATISSSVDFAGSITKGQRQRSPETVLHRTTEAVITIEDEHLNSNQQLAHKVDAAKKNNFMLNVARKRKIKTFMNIPETY